MAEDCTVARHSCNCVHLTLQGIVMPLACLVELLVVSHDLIHGPESVNNEHSLQ